MNTIDQIKEASILGLIRTKKVIDIIETKPKRKSGHRGYYAIYVNGNSEPYVIGPKSKVDVVEKVIWQYQNFKNYEKRYIERRAFDKMKSDGHFSL